MPTCEQCGLIVSTRVILNRHMVTHASKRPFVCTVCNKGFTRRDHLNIHRRIHSGDKPFSCQFCDFAASTSYAIKRHIRSRQKCDYCEQSFCTVSSRYDHVRITHASEKQFWQCEACLKTFANGSLLKKHLLKSCKKVSDHEEDCSERDGLEIQSQSGGGEEVPEEHSIASFEIDPDSEDGSSFVQELENHPTTFERDPDSKRKLSSFTCPLCGKGLFSKQVLERHMYGHSDYRPFVCTICSKGFTRKDRFNQHLLQHSGVRPHKCEFCDYAAVDRDFVVKHVKSVHFKERYGCKVCEKTFARPSRLKAHSKLHTGNGLVKCEVCDKVFKTQWELNQHRKVHTRTEEDRWPCELCGATFAKKHGRELHQRKCNGQTRNRNERSSGRSKNKSSGDKSPSKKGIRPAPGRETLTCLQCQGEFLSIPDMYKHQCPGKPS